MGTRADFYVKKDDQYEWHGSISWDGYPESISKAILKSKSEPEFLEALEKFLSKKKGITDRWPWPWFNSNTTDYAYIFSEEKGVVYISHFGSKTITPYQYKEFVKEDLEAQEHEMDSDFQMWTDKVGHFYPRFPNMKI